MPSVGEKRPAEDDAEAPAPKAPTTEEGFTSQAAAKKSKGPEMGTGTSLDIEP